MAAYEYIVPITYVPEDNETFIGKQLIMVKNCNQEQIVNSCDGWNFNHCMNDNNYYQPFKIGDKIYKQLRVETTQYTLDSIEIINTDTGENFYSDSFVTTQTGLDTIKNTYYNWVIDTSNAAFNNVSCWYVRIVLEPVLAYLEQVVITGEPYRLLKCNEKTLLIEGSYSKGFDCFGNYYGEINQVSSIYKPVFRIPGVVEEDGFDFEQTANNNIIVKSAQTERFMLLTQKIPYYVARQIAVCFNSKRVTIDEIEYTGTVKLSKNFEEGSMWIIKESILIVCDEINFTCD